MKKGEYHLKYVQCAFDNDSSQKTFVQHDITWIPNESRPGAICIKPLTVMDEDDDRSARVMLDVEDDETRLNRLSMLLTFISSFPLI